MPKHFLYTAFLAIVVTLIINGVIFLCSAKSNVSTNIKEIVKIETDGTITSVISDHQKEIESVKSKILYLEGENRIFETQLSSIQDNQSKTTERLLTMQTNLVKQITDVDVKATTQDKTTNGRVDSAFKLLDSTIDDLNKAKSDIVTNKECIDNLIKVLEIQRQTLSETKDKISRITRMFYNYDQVQATLEKEQK